MRRILVIWTCAALGTAAWAQTPNDLCASAILVFDGVNPSPPLGVSGSFYGNAGTGTEGVASCAWQGSTNDVWFTYTATSSGFAIITTCTPPGFAYGSLSGTVLSVYSSCGGAELACSHLASCGLPFARLAVLLTAGTSYVIRVAGKPTAIGTFYLTITPSGPPPANDACANASPVLDGVNPGPPGAFFTNAGATPEGVNWCAALSAYQDKDVWFSYTATATGVRIVTTCTPPGYVPGSLATSLAVFSSCGGTHLGCSATPLCPTVAVPMTVGTNYRIRVASLYNGEGATGSFYVSILTPATNDECVNAVPLSLGQNGPFTNAAATPSAGLLAPCLGIAGSTDLWYSFTTGACPGSYTIDTCPDYAIMPSVYTACGTVPLGCGVAFPPTPCGGARVTFNATAFTPYLIRVSAPPGWSGSYNVIVNQGSVMTLAYASPGGPGCIQANLSGVPSGGLYFIAVTLNAGAFPAGAFYGIDISPAELLAEFTNGYPFSGAADSCGNVQVGQFCGPLSGTTIYSVAFGFAGAYSLTPAKFTPPVSYTVP